MSRSNTGPGPGPGFAGPGPEVRVRGPQKGAGPDLDRTLDSLILVDRNMDMFLQREFSMQEKCPSWSSCANCMG